MEVQNKGVESTHSLNMTDRKLLGIDGVSNLESYDHEKILLQTSAGVLEIKGEQLHIQQLNLDHGKVIIEGVVGSLIYTEASLNKKGKGLLSKLIK